MSGAAARASAGAGALWTLGALTALFWALMLWSLANMAHPLVQMMMPRSTAWTGAEALLVWLMWAVMMGAMMLPSAIPMVVAYRRLSQNEPERGTVAAFVLSYVFAWAVFSAAATGAQWGFQGLGVLSRMLVLTNPFVAAAVLIVAGVSQWTPLKAACLNICRTPIGFLTTEWRPGLGGAVRMGLRHGTYCIGCCWALMALLFAFGVMNLWAIGLLTGIVAAEKLLPRGDLIARAGGVVLIAWGAWLLLSAL